MKKLTTVCLAVFIAGCNTMPARQVSYRTDFPGVTSVGAERSDRYGKLEEMSRDVVKKFSVEVAEYLKKNKKSAAVAKGKSAVANMLKDPGSAQFRNVRLVPYGQGSVICGEVNGKNSYGGYVGFKAFVAGINFAEMERTGGEYADIDRAANTGITEACG